MLHHPGPGDLPIFGDMPDHNHRHALAFGIAGQLMGGGSYLANRAGGRFDVIGPHRLNGIDDDQIGLFSIQGGQNIAQIGLSGEDHRAFAKTKALGAHAHLRRGFLARDVNDLQTIAGETCGGLQQQSGFADPRIPTDQERAGLDQSASQNPVQFCHASHGARGRFFHRGQIGQRDGPAPFAAKGFAWTGRERTLVHQSVPLHAAVALTGPFAMRRAAFAAGECRFGHVVSFSSGLEI